MQKVNLNNIEKLDFRSRESYKTLRTNLEFAGRARKVVAVTSCTPNEGKTSVSFRLALSMAESGKRVVLVDADLRKSVLRSMYRVSAARYGLSHYLSGQSPVSDVLYETNVPDFYAIFSGPVPPNPSELLGSGAFGLLLEYLRKEYDYVVVDTPPLGSVIDGAVAAKQCDGAILVIESGSVSHKFAQSVREQLDRAGCSVLGVVLNKVDLGSGGYYGSYGKYYGKYYGRYYGMYGADEDGGLADAVSNRPGAGRSEKAGRREKIKQEREKPEKGRQEILKKTDGMERAEQPGQTGGSGKKIHAEGAESPEHGEDGGTEEGAGEYRNGKQAGPGNGAADGTERHGKSGQRDNRPGRRERNASRKAAQGKDKTGERKAGKGKAGNSEENRRNGEGGAARTDGRKWKKDPCGRGGKPGAWGGWRNGRRSRRIPERETGRPRKRRCRWDGKARKERAEGQPPGPEGEECEPEGGAGKDRAAGRG